MLAPAQPHPVNLLGGYNAAVSLRCASAEAPVCCGDAHKIHLRIASLPPYSVDVTLFACTGR